LQEEDSVRDDDIILGDDGEIDYEAGTGIILTIETYLGVDALAVGGSDEAYGNKHDDIIFGGIAGDLLKGDDGMDGDDVILGDNGLIVYELDDDGERTMIATIETTDTSEATGGPDTIEGQDDNDVIIGGVNNGGPDLLYGDMATPNADGDLDTLDFIRSELLGLGGADELSGNAGNDVLIGSTGGDTMYGDDASASAAASDGEDIMLGDNGDIEFIGTVGRLLVQVIGRDVPSAVDLITTTDVSDAFGGADTMSGNAVADIMLGGVNDGGVDTMYGDQAPPTDVSKLNDGDDILLGDNGLLDFTHLTDLDRNTLDLIQTFEDTYGGTDIISGNRGLDVGIGGTGDDTIYGDDDPFSAGALDLNDILIGDNADIFLVAVGGASGADLKVVLDAAVKTIVTTDTLDPDNTGGVDTISGNAGGDVILGGVYGDLLYGDREVPTPESTAIDGDDMILGDNGSFEWLSTGRLGEVTGIDISANNADLYAWFNGGDGDPADTDLGTLDLITTEQPNSGGRDIIFGDEGNDLVFGGTDLDVIHGDDGDYVGSTDNNDVLFGDHGRIYPQFARFQVPNSTALVPADIPARNFFAIDTGDTDGGAGDIMFGEEGDDLMVGQQGDDRMWGGSQDDDMIGGHNVDTGYDELGSPVVDALLNPPDNLAMNDIMDGGSGDDAMAGDNAIVWRRGDVFSPRFRELTEDAIYTTGPDQVDTIITNFDVLHQQDPENAVGRDVQLLDHTDAIELNPLGRYGADVMAGGPDNDVLYGQLGDDLMQGDGLIEADPALNPWVSHELDVSDTGVAAPDDTSETLYFNIPENVTDGNDYMEGNGGNDLMYGGLGQDDMIGGSSELFGLDDTNAALLTLTGQELRPDGSDILFGGSGVNIGRNHLGHATIPDPETNAIITDPTGHARDADYIMGDNANLYRLVEVNADASAPDVFLEYEYDQTGEFENRGDERIIVRAMEQLDYTLGGSDYAGGSYTSDGVAVVGGIEDNGRPDLIHGEAGDDHIFGMTGSDVIYGEGQDDDIVGGYGNDWISGGTGQDGILGDDGLVLTSRNSAVGEPLYGIAGLIKDVSTRYSNGDALDELISTPGSIQIALINPKGALKKTIDLVPFSYDPLWLGMDDEFPENGDATPFADDFIFGGLGSDFLHGGSGDDGILGAEALSEAYIPMFDIDGNAVGIINLGYNAFDITNPINPGDVATLTGNPGDALGYNPVDEDGQHQNNRYRAGEFFLYDEYDPRRKILLTATGELWKPGDGDSFEFILNFDETEGVIRPAGEVPKATGQQTEFYPQVNDDGKDALFGDLGNDWLVGGTGRDNLYGGWGNDLLNADDLHDINDDSTKQNTVSDTHPTYEDRIPVVIG
jgi:Ca2+-binding RTX toxin-like protein